MDTKRLLHENGKMLRRWMALFKSEELMVELEGRTGALERKALEPPQIRWSSESTTTQPSELGFIRFPGNNFGLERGVIVGLLRGNPSSA